MTPPTRPCWRASAAAGLHLPQAATAPTAAHLAEYLLVPTAVVKGPSCRQLVAQGLHPSSCTSAGRLRLATPCLQALHACVRLKADALPQVSMGMHAKDGKAGFC